MTGFQGMDPVVMRGVAQRLRQQAQRLEDVISSVQHAVEEAFAHWDGEDAHGFNGWWSSHYRPALVSAQATLAEAAATVERNIAEQEGASGTGAGQVSAALAGGTVGARTELTGPRDLLSTLLPASLLGTAGDIVETATGWGIDDLPGGKYLGSTLKGIGLGSAAVEFFDSTQHHDLSGIGASTVDGVMTFVPSPVSLLWTGLKEQVSFFIPLDYSEQDAHLVWMREERGMSDTQISERYTGVQGFIDLGNDNAARHAPWLVEGADKLMEKPAEWLYNVGIKL